MSAPSTSILDHIIHLTPPDTVEEVSQQFRNLGFNVVPGGVHSGGLSANALVVLGDGIYVELISFTHPISHYPPGSPDRHQRETNPWAHKEPGWIDFAFLGSAETSVARIVNARAARDHSGIHYADETPGGRTRTDGQVVKWVITFPEDDRLRGIVPFFCGDVTPRELRVPVFPPSNADHPSGVRGVAHIRLLAETASLASLAAKLTSVLGEHAEQSTRQGSFSWQLEVPHAKSDTKKPRLVLGMPEDDEEERHLGAKGPGIYEVAFWVGSGGEEGVSKTPFGKILWLRH